MNTNQQEKRFDVLKKVAAFLLAGLFVVLWTFVSASACPGNNKGESGKDQTPPKACGTQVFRRTYDDVFQATVEALEKKGKILDASDKGKGIITHKENYLRYTRLYTHTDDCRMMVELQIESLASTAEPQTRVTVNTRDDGSGPKGCRKGPQYGCGIDQDTLFSDIQKVLATYN